MMPTIETIAALLVSVLVIVAMPRKMITDHGHCEPMRQKQLDPAFQAEMAAEDAKFRAELAVLEANANAL